MIITVVFYEVSFTVIFIENALPQTFGNEIFTHEHNKNPLLLMITNHNIRGDFCQLFFISFLDLFDFSKTFLRACSLSELNLAIYKSQ